MPDVTHVFVTHESGFGYSMVSPQLPGFVFVRETQGEMMVGYRPALAAEGVYGQVVGHEQIRGVSASGIEYVVRWCTDRPENVQRLVTAQRLVGALSDVVWEGELPLDDVDGGGVCQLVCCLPQDTLGWLVEQLDRRGDVFTAVIAVDAERLYLIKLATDGTRGWPSVEENGWSLDMTMADLMARRSDADTQRVLVTA